MVGTKLEPSVVSYNAGIKACEKGEQWQRALALLSEMWEAKLEPDVFSCSGGIRACGKSEQWQWSLALLSEMSDAKLEPDIIIRSFRGRVCAVGSSEPIASWGPPGAALSGFGTAGGTPGTSPSDDDGLRDYTRACAKDSDVVELSGWSGFSDFEASPCSYKSFGELDALFEPVGARCFDYHRFIRAFKAFEAMGTFDSFENVRMPPAADWFDVEMAIRSRPDFFAFFQPVTINAVKSVAMSVNRWNFMKVCMISGQDWMTFTLPYALLVLAVIHDSVDLTMRGLRMLDAGCGSGFLMALWAEMTRPDAEIWGLDQDPDMVYIARRELCESRDTFAEGQAGKCSKIRVARGDIHRMRIGSPSAVVLESSLDELEPLPSVYFDVIVLGVAVKGVLERAVECLSEGGVLVVAVQLEGSPVICDAGATRTASQFQVWRKDGGVARRLGTLGCDGAGDGLRINFIT